MDPVEGRVAFVTGGASGIGLGMAKAFARAGMKVAIADLRQDHLDAAVDWFGEAGHGDSVMALKLDVTDRPGFAAAADAVEARFGTVQLLCNNAGMGLVGPIANIGYDDWDWGIGVMIGGVVNGIQTFLPRMRALGQGGHVVNTASMAALMPIPGCSIYITTKAAVVGMAESLRGELAPEGIGVSAFCPGPVQTNIRESGRNRPDRFRKDTGLAEFEARLEQRPNSPNWMTIEECGERVLAGIRRNDLYILTHPEFRDGTRERFDYIQASYPDEPIDQVRAGEIGFLLSNAIYRRKD
jgi:NAD(P)-dependent dehydrogenase (short-subunit alcohol dehydrogenase family)